MKQLDEEIQKTYAEVKQKEKFIHRLELISEKILQQELLLSELDQQKNSELNDVKALESDSLRNIFLFFLGNKEEALEIERQEFVWAQLNYLACKRRIKALKIDKESISEEIAKFHLSNNYLDELLVRKQRRIKKSVKEFAKYKSLNDRVLQREHMLKEIHEAQNAGTTLLDKISDLKIQLTLIQKEDTWGSMDYATAQKYHGKGNYSSYEKKQFEKLSQEIIYEIDRHILKFKSELDDIHSSFELDYTRHLIILEEFLPIFYDNLITDWVVQREIINAQRSTNILFSRVERILLMLEHEHQTVHNEIDFYRLKRREYLLEQ